MPHQLLLDIVDAIEDSGNIVVLILPASYKDEEEENPYEDFREGEAYEVAGGAGESLYESHIPFATDMTPFGF